MSSSMPPQGMLLTYRPSTKKHNRTYSGGVGMYKSLAEPLTHRNVAACPMHGNLMHMVFCSWHNQTLPHSLFLTQMTQSNAQSWSTSMKGLGTLEFTLQQTEIQKWWKHTYGAKLPSILGHSNKPQHLAVKRLGCSTMHAFYQLSCTHSQ